MKRIEILVMTFIVCLSGIVLAGGMDDLIAAGGRLELKEFQTAAETGQAAVTLKGRARSLIKVTKIVQKPAASEDNTIAVSLVTKDGTTVSLYSLGEATHSEVRVDDLENKVYYADGGTNVAATSIYPVWLRDGDTLSLQGTTNAVVAGHIEYVVIPLRR
jgi:hypothetical protein